MNLSEVYCGDCLDIMRSFPSNSVDLIMTSPPYADARKHTYGGVAPDHYVEWFLPRAEEMKRVLKPTGSFVLNIKEKTVDGERHTYVLELILSMRKELGWRWVEEYVWRKTDAMPGIWKNRFRDGWERLLHFSKAIDFKMTQENVMVAPQESTLKAGSYLNPYDKTRDVSKTDSGFGIVKFRAKNRQMVYPDNVIESSSEAKNSGHSAVYPVGLPTFFVKLFTDADDVVLDPFCGSGTTMAAAQSLGRHWIGIDKDQSSVDLSRDRLNKTQPALIPA